MTKIAIIESCWGCPHLSLSLDDSVICSKTNVNMGHLEDIKENSIPNFCPLDNLEDFE